MSDESTLVGEDGSGKGTLDVREVQPAHRICPAKRPLSSIQAVDICAADDDADAEAEANFSGPVVVSPADAENATIDIAKHAQASLVKACKRHRLSTSGAKSALLSRFKGAGVASNAALRTASNQLHMFQEPAERGDAVRRQDPNRSMHETARLCHVIADPRHATALRKLYQIESNRSELDSGRHDPWSNEFMDLFNDPNFNPDVPEWRAGNMQCVLDRLRPEDVRHERDGSRLKEPWQKLRSSFTIAYNNWSKSGQNDPKEFAAYTQGDDALVYTFCVFHNQPSLDYALRLLPEGGRAECGVPDVDSTLDQSVLRDRRRAARSTTNSGSASGKESLAECVSSIADALKQPIVL
jgi:hypothetical protein